MGRPGANLAGLRDEDIFTDLDAVRRLRRSDEIILQSGQSVHLQEEATYPDGRRVLLDTLKTPFYDSEGSLVGLLGISRDVSKRVAAERAAVAEKENALIIKSQTPIRFI